MPVKKHYECTDSMNRLDVLLSECESELLLKVSEENGNEIQIRLTRYDLCDLISELEIIDDLIYEKEKGGSNG